MSEDSETHSAGVGIALEPTVAAAVEAGGRSIIRGEVAVSATLEMARARKKFRRMHAPEPSRKRQRMRMMQTQIRPDFQLSGTAN